MLIMGKIKKEFSMINFDKYEIWFLTGSQHLYGPETLKQVEEHSKIITSELSSSEIIPFKVVYKPVLTTPDSITNVCLEANNSRNCIGLITWMHTFSPAKMWIGGLKILQKPFVHLHTQFNRDIPWSEIDMDFMNLNQSAHGGREFGFICTRMKKNRKVIVGHWQDPQVQKELGIWSRAACAWHDFKNVKIARFGDNMREVAVTEGDKVEAQMCFGYSVNGYGVGDLVEVINAVKDSAIDTLIDEYTSKYVLGEKIKSQGKNHKGLRDAARIELGIRKFMVDGGFSGFTTTFEDLHGLNQLMGISVQRLMAEGYGFGAEGDWKTAALVRAIKVMAHGLKGGTTFMEDYTYHLDPAGMKVLGAHMLEICESVAQGKPVLESHPLSIGGKEDPPRLIFNAPAGPAINASLIDLGHRFRMIVNEVDVVEPDAPLPKLPVARALWIPRPNLQVAAQSWITAGGAHHTGFSQAITSDYIEDFCEIADIEMVKIDSETKISEFKKELRWNDAYYSMR
jgi:L-arabinose isomerase